MIRKKSIYIFLALVLLLSNVFCVPSLAAESDFDSQMEITVIDISSEQTKMEINDDTFYFDKITGEITRPNGAVVARIYVSDIPADLYSVMASKPASSVTHHGLNIASRWTYMGDSWTTGEVYENSENVVISAIISCLAYFGLSMSSDTVKQKAGKLISAIINHFSFGNTSVYFYIRRYSYGNKNYISDFGYVYQGYDCDYNAKEVLSYTNSLLY